MYKGPWIFFDVHLCLSITSSEDLSLAANSGILKPHSLLLLPELSRELQMKTYGIKNNKQLKKMLCSPLKKITTILLSKLMAHKIFIECTFQST